MTHLNCLEINGGVEEGNGKPPQHMFIPLNNMAEDLNIDKTEDVNGILLNNQKDVASGRSGRESRNDFSNDTQVDIKRNPDKEKDITKIGT